MLIQRDSILLSYYKNLSKSIWSSTKKGLVRVGPGFLKKEDKATFKFQHFIKPEQLVDEYIRTSVCSKTCLVKIEKYELLKSSPIICDCELDLDFNSHDCREFVCSRGKRTFRRKETKVTEDNAQNKLNNIQMIRSTKRIPATHNFVYEFDPFGNGTLNLDDVPQSKESHNIAAFGQGDLTSKHAANIKPKRTLPKLNPRADFSSTFEKQEYATIAGENTNLPTIKRQETAADRRLNRERFFRHNRHRAEISEIDREVEKVKSDWQALRAEQSWAQGKKYLANSRTKKLYETLEKVNDEIDKIQKSYLDPKANQFLQRGAARALEDARRPSFEEDAERIRSILFPKENPREGFSGGIKGIGKNVSNETSTKIASTSRLLENKKRSIVSNKLERKLIKSDSCLSANFDSRKISGNRLKSTYDSRRGLETYSKTEDYFEKYINDAEKGFIQEKDQTIEEFEPLTDEVADILAKLSVNSHDIYDVSDEDREINYDEYSYKSKKKGKDVAVENYAISDEMLDANEAIGELINENVSLVDTSIQANVTKQPACNQNIFMEMGLQTLNTNIPKSVLSRVLRSDYLKKDISLKPM